MPPEVVDVFPEVVMVSWMVEAAVLPLVEIVPGDGVVLLVVLSEVEIADCWVVIAVVAVVGASLVDTEAAVEEVAVLWPDTNTDGRSITRRKRCRIQVQPGILGKKNRKIYFKFN